MSGWSKSALAHKFSEIEKNTVKELRPDVQAALMNEQITRQRVDKIEALLGRGLWGRLTYLVLGR